MRQTNPATATNPFVVDTARDDRTELLLALGRGLHQAGLPTDTTEELLREVAIAVGVAMQVNILPTSLTLAVDRRSRSGSSSCGLSPGRCICANSRCSTAS